MLSSGNEPQKNGAIRDDNRDIGSFDLANIFKAMYGEASNTNSLLTAGRSSEVDAGDGTRSRRQRLFWLLFWSQKSDKWLFNCILTNFVIGISEQSEFNRATE
jgi:hypothetical protein